MKLKSLLACSVLLLAWTVTLSAQEDEAYAKIKPLLKQNTIVVAHVNVEKLGYDRMVEKMKPLLLTAIDTALKNTGLEQDEKAKHIREETENGFGNDTSGQSIDALVAGGVKELYILCIQDLLKDYPMILAMPGEVTLSSEVQEVFEKENITRAGTVEGFTLFVAEMPEVQAAMPGGAPGMSGGMPGGGGNTKKKPLDVAAFLNTFNRLKPMDENPAYETEFKLHGNSPIRVVFAPTKGLKAMAQLAVSMHLKKEEGEPPTPFDLSPEKAVNVIRHFQLGSLGVAPGSLRLNVTALFDSEESAAETQKLFADLFEAVNAFEIPKDEDSEANPFAVLMEVMFQMMKAMFNPVLIPEINKDRVNLRLNEKKIEQFVVDYFEATLPYAVKADSFQMNFGPMGGGDDEDDDKGGTFFD